MSTFKKNIAFLLILIALIIVGVYFWKFYNQNSINHIIINSVIKTNNMQFTKEGYIKISGGDEVYTASEIIFKPALKNIAIELKKTANYGYFHDNVYSKDEEIKDFSSFTSSGQMEKLLSDLESAIKTLKKSDLDSLDNMVVEIQLSGIVGTWNSDAYDLEPLLDAIETFIVYNNKFRILDSPKIDNKKIDNKTSQFIGSGFYKIGLSDLHGLYGGRNLIVDSSGNISLGSASVPQQGNSLSIKTHKITLDKTVMKDLIDEFINNDFCSLKSDMPESVLPDTSFFTISLANSKEEECEITTTHQSNIGPNEYGSSDRKKIDSIYKKLLNIEKSIK